MEQNSLIYIAYGLILLAIVSSVGSAILINYGDSQAETSSTSSSFLYLSSAGLNPHGRGMLSLSAQVYNNTWFNCTDDYINHTSPTIKRSISLWYNNDSGEGWISYIKSGYYTYINGELQSSWNYEPYFIEGNSITFCMSDSSTFVNVSIDQVRLYNDTLNIAEIQEVYNEGR